MVKAGIRSSPLVLGLVVLILSSLAVPHGLLSREGIADTGLYGEYGAKIVSGKVPYRDFSMEFPPGAAVPLALPALVGEDDGFSHRFKLLQSVFLGVTVLATVAALGALGVSRLRKAVAGAFVGATPLLLGPITLNAFDAWPAMLVSLAALLFAVRRDLAGGVLLGLAATAKLYPLFVIPVLFAWGWRKDGPRRAAARLGALLAAGAVVLLPFVVVAFGGVGFSLETQLKRGLQVESLGGSLLLSLDAVGLHDVSVVTSTNPHSFDVAGALASAVGGISTAIALAAVLAPAFLISRVKLQPGREDLLLAATGAIAMLLAFNKVFSPQYLIWLVPLVALVRPGVIWVLTGCSLVLTHVWFPSRFDDVTRGEPIILIVLLRNLLVVAIGLLLLRALAKQLRARDRSDRHEEHVPRNG